MPSIQEHPTIVSDDTSALYRVWYTSGFPRLIYGAYVVLGIIFYGIAVFTAFNIVLHTLNDDTILTPKIALFLCYVLLNGIIGYGFIFYRKWLLVVFSGTLVHTGLLAIINGEKTLPTSILILVGILFFLFLTRHFLSGRYLRLKTVVPFTILLLISFMLTNFTVLK
ncbi:MAG: hypothetical protein Q7R59_02765 [bacterium]|nr:hypothetical protein [bacterium]